MLEGRLEKDDFFYGGNLFSIENECVMLIYFLNLESKHKKSYNEKNYFTCI